MKQVRASLGTLAVLGMELMFMDAPPTTAYLQIFTDQRCRANCLFCSQAKDSKGELKHIARGQYLPADLEEVVRRLGIAFEKGYLHRACIQTAMYPGMWEDTVYLIGRIRDICSIPVSLSVFPLDDAKYRTLAGMDVDQLVIPLDASTPELFHSIKGEGAGGPFSWDGHLDGLKRAAVVFPQVGTHIIVGMGETEQEVVELVDRLHKMGIHAALFAYTRLPGTRAVGDTAVNAEPDIGHYRRVQMAAYLLRNDRVRLDDMVFSGGVVSYFGLEEQDLKAVMESGEAFMTTGCSNCNRPYATETHDPVYNYPATPDSGEINGIKQQMETVKEADMEHGL
ncbi:MAG: radical SAM protein [ANME-2 cluster archaeon]|nr:radical SAM protein [ANME-2 cluster archaeon]